MRIKKIMIGTVTAGVLMVGVSAAESRYGIVVYPETPTTVELSNRDVNRVVCQSGAIENFKFSAEKGALIEADGADAYIKFQIKKTGDREEYATARSEFFIKCDGVVYTILAAPKNRAAQTVFLGLGQTRHAQENADRFRPLSDEEAVVEISHAVLRDEFPASYGVRLENERFAHSRSIGADVRKRRSFSIEGSSLRAVEYSVRALRDLTLDEWRFLSPEFGPSIYGVTLETQQLRAGEVGSVVIVYRETSNPLFGGR